MKIKKVLLSAGVHGNEKTPIFLLKKFQKNSIPITRSNFKTEILIANPQAVKLHQRYIDVDLNRCFSSEKLDNPHPLQYEEIQAQAINRRVQESQIDLILDFHTTTSSNMGITLLLSNDRPFNLKLAAYLAEHNDLVRIVLNAEQKQNNRLRHLIPLGMTVEIGGIAPNVVDPVWVERLEYLVQQILDYLEQINQDRPPVTPKIITLYSLQEPVYFPTDDQGEIVAMVHPNLHGSDYSVLNPDEPMFIDLDGNNIYYSGETANILFVSESAYLEKQIAFYLATKKKISIE